MSKEKLMQKLIEIDSQGHYVGSYGTASFLDYTKAVKEGYVEIHDKKYKDKISKIIKNDIE